MDIALGTECNEDIEDCDEDNDTIELGQPITVMLVHVLINHHQGACFVVFALSVLSTVSITAFSWLLSPFCSDSEDALDSGCARWAMSSATKAQNTALPNSNQHHPLLLVFSDRL
jgi:hypothetical protein